MSDTALSLLTRSLRLINVPGRGAELDAADITSAFETLKDLLAAQSGVKAFQPGIVRHFFAMTAGQVSYHYGPGGDFDTDAFEDPVPVRIEDAYIRSGVAIADNEEVTGGDFSVSAPWTIVGAWTILNGEAVASDTGTLSQALGLLAGRTYTVRVSLTVEVGDVVFRVLQNGAPLLEVTLSESGDYEYEVGFAGGTSGLDFVTNAATDDLALQDVSIIESGREALELPDGGQDYMVRVLDQKAYNQLGSKAEGGRPGKLLFSRSWPLAIVRFESAGETGDVVVFDALVNRIEIATVNDPIRLHNDALKWLRYKLADELAGEYGKELKPRQVATMNEAYDLLSAGNQRANRLRVDLGLRPPRRYDINRGD